jgi:hypothetical protein
VDLNLTSLFAVLCVSYFGESNGDEMIRTKVEWNGISIGGRM